MATTNQLSVNGDSVSSFVDRYIGDDWGFTFDFADSSGTAIDMSSYTWTANLITEPSGVYTSVAISGVNGSVTTAAAASGTIGVTVSDLITSGLAADMDSVDIASSTQSTFNTRLALIGTIDSVSKTFAVTPIRVIRR